MSTGQHNDGPSLQERRLSRSGPLAWMTANPVAANLLMLLFIIGGIVMSQRVKQEVFPEFQLDLVNVQVPYPGASPAEVEQGVILAIEEGVRGIDGVQKVRSAAREGMGSVTIELERDADPDVLLTDVRSAVDRVTSFPEESERPIISLATNRSEVLLLVISGDASEAELRDLANNMRDRLLVDPRISQIDLAGVRPLEISIEVREEAMRRYGLTIGQIAQAVRAASVELPGGEVETSGGEILLRTTERREDGAGFEEIVLLSQPDGTRVHVSDVADVIDGFRDTDQQTRFNGNPAATLRVFRVGDQTPLSVAAAVEEFIEENESDIPEGIGLTIVNDQSQMYAERIQMLNKNAVIGLALVLLVLGLFLEIRLAFWVTLGIPISFFGAMLFMPALDVSVNMISLFAFILTLGIVVDDAIVVGEAVYYQRQKGLSGLDAAISGVREVVVPVSFSIVTTIVAFVPMLFVPGAFGKIMRVIPIIVISILLISLIESVLILPAHLAHSKPGFSGGLLGLVYRGQQAFGRFFDRMIERVYVPSMRVVLRYRYATLAMGIGVLIITGSLVAAGVVKRTFFPKIEGDFVAAKLEMPDGTAGPVTVGYIQRMERVAQEIIDENGGDDILMGIYTTVGSQGLTTGGPGGRDTATGGYLGEVNVFMVPIAERDITAAEFTRQWRERVGEIPGVDRLQYVFNNGPSAGSPIDLELSHTNVEALERAAEDLAGELSEFAGVIDIDDGVSLGKPQLDLRLLPAARAYGVTESDLARQVRDAFFGAEAVRQQRGRDELRVYVRRAESQRTSRNDIEEMLILTPQGGTIPLREAASVDQGRAYTTIERVDGRRVINVTADIVEGQANANEVAAKLQDDVLPGFLAERDGLAASFAGEQEEQSEVNSSLASGMMIALFAMYGLMAIAFRSYTQPIIIMTAIPFGLVGAVGGHLLLGYSISLLSLFGLVALMGVVVNDTLVLVTAINELRDDEGMPIAEASIAGGARRLRPIMLTSLTTFFGLTPMILETSMQAKFLIPMAISLGFGVLFTAFTTLGFVPVLYVLLEDFHWLTTKVASILDPTADSDEEVEDAPAWGTPPDSGLDGPPTAEAASPAE